MKIYTRKGAIGLILALLCCAAAPATQPSPAELAIVRPLLAEADKQAIALRDKLSDSMAQYRWLEAHIRAGDWNAAKTIIDATSPAARAKLYEAACIEAAGAGDVKLAQQILDEHVQGDQQRQHCIVAISRGLAWQGKIDAAIAELNLISRPNPKLSPLMALAIAQNEAGDQAGAKASCEQIAEIVKHLDPPPSPGTLMDITEAVAQAGEMNTAIALAEGVKDKPSQSFARFGIELGEANAGNFALIEATADPSGCIDSGIYRANHGDIPGAQRLAKLCPNPHFADVIRASIGHAQVRAGDIPGALATAGQDVTDPFCRIMIYEHVIRAQRLAGDAKGAADTFALAQNAASNMPPAARSYRTLLQAQVAMGDTQAAIAAIAKSSNDPSKLLGDYSIAAAREFDSSIP